MYQGNRILFSKGLAMLLVMLFILPVMASSGTLKGIVTNYSDGLGLIHAIITLSSNDPTIKAKSIAADENGEFVITDIVSGVYTVKVTYVGFTSWTELDVEISGDVELNAILVPVAINMNAISVTTSRRPEKILEAPASVSMIESAEIESRSTLTPAEHIKGLPGVDVATTGLGQSNVVVRGFNNIFSGSLLILTDNRIARVPSLRFNAHNFLTTVNSDIDRIEIVSGPGSALYGPNSATGVMHILTKSPFSSQGTTVSFGGGERSLGIGSFRHAGLIGDKIGYKFTGQYYEGNDWESFDINEPDKIMRYRPTSLGKDFVDTDSISNDRDFDMQKMSGEARFDFLIGDNSKLILNGGYNKANQIELTGLGAGQAIDWKYYFAQARYTYKDLFIQGYVNASDAGDTYLLQTGQLIVDKSKLWVGQIQHSYTPNDKYSFIYGIDALLTRPNTDSTINGRNEADDNINEIGVYVQGDAKLHDKLKLVGAIRIDDHNRLEDMIFSPRAAIVFQPDEFTNYRFTYNRAFSTPDNNTLYLDILQLEDPFEIGSKFAPAFGFSPNIDIRVQGVPETGFHWNINDNGPQFRSPFAPLDPRSITNEDFIEYNDPIFTNVMWSVGRGAVMSGLQDQLSGVLDPATLATVLGAVNTVAPTTVSGVENTLMTFNPDILGFVPASVDDLVDIERMKPTITQTFEFGYKGLIGNNLQVALDVYRTKKNDFIGPLTIENLNVFMDPATLQADLTAQIVANLTDLAVNDPDAYDSLTFYLDQNGNGSAADDLIGSFTLGAASIPFGTVSPAEQLDPDAILVTYRNFGDITFYGADVVFAYQVNQNWNFGASYSYVSKNFFDKDVENEAHDVFLNAPKHKVSFNLKYTNQKNNISAQARLRMVDSFEMVSPFVGTTVPSYEVLDINLGIDIIPDTRLTLTIQNALDQKHIEFVGAPEIGRLAIMRVTQSF